MIGDKSLIIGQYQAHLCLMLVFDFKFYYGLIMFFKKILIFFSIKLIFLFFNYFDKLTLKINFKK